MKKLCARWVCKIDQKRIRVNNSEQNLAYFNCNPREFLRRFVTMDETWIHYYTPDSREASREWVEPGGSAPNDRKLRNRLGKLWPVFFGMRVV